MNLFRINPGHFDAFWADMRQHLKPIYDEYKRRGIITDYSVATKSTTESADDWDVRVALFYKNWAALDGLGRGSRSGHARMTDAPAATPDCRHRNGRRSVSTCAGGARLCNPVSGS